MSDEKDKTKVAKLEPNADTADLELSPEAAATVKEYRAKNPKARLFTFSITGDDRTFVARVGTFAQMGRFSNLFDNPKVAIDKTAASFFASLLIYPKISYEELNEEMLPGHVSEIIKSINAGNGFGTEAEIKNI